MDANDEDDLKAKLLSKKEEWNKKERKYLPEGKTPTFYNYLLAKVKNNVHYRAEETTILFAALVQLYQC